MCETKVNLFSVDAPKDILIKDVRIDKDPEICYQNNESSQHVCLCVCVCVYTLIHIPQPASGIMVHSHDCL